MRTLVLNAGFEPILMVSWQRALCLVLSEKAEVVAEYERAVRSVSISFQLPSVVRLHRYVRSVRRFGLVPCSRKNVFTRDNYECQYCSVKCTPKTATIDHVWPRSKGGKTSWENVVCCCDSCNRKKGNKLLKQTPFELKRKPRQPTWKEFLERSLLTSLAKNPKIFGM